MHSPFGRVVKAIKQNETRARFVGYDVWRYKAAVLVVSAGALGPRRRPVRDGADIGLSRRHEPALFGLRRDDDAGRRRPRLLLGAGDRRRRLLPRPRRDRRATTGWMLWFGLFFVMLVLFKPEGIAGMFAGAATRERKAAPRRAANPQPQAR